MAQTEKQFFTNAVDKSGAINASAFARKLGVSPASLSEWKKGKTYPSDKTMLKIALLCDLDPVEALAWLNLKRCDEAAKPVYERLLHVAQSTALRCFPYICALILASQANMPNLLKDNETSNSDRAVITCKATHSHHYAIFAASIKRGFRAVLYAVNRISSHILNANVGRVLSWV